MSAVIIIIVPYIKCIFFLTLLRCFPLSLVSSCLSMMLPNGIILLFIYQRFLQHPWSMGCWVYFSINSVNCSSSLNYDLLYSFLPEDWFSSHVGIFLFYRCPSLLIFKYHHILGIFLVNSTYMDCVSWK